MPLPWRVPGVKPEPIPIHVKVVLLGDSQLYYMLDAMDPDFPHLFKVLADFESIIDRTPEALRLYAAVLARLARGGVAPAVRPAAVAALCEHGARIAARAGQADRPLRPPRRHRAGGRLPRRRRAARAPSRGDDVRRRHPAHQGARRPAGPALPRAWWPTARIRVQTAGARGRPGQRARRDPGRPADLRLPHAHHRDDRAGHGRRHQHRARGRALRRDPQQGLLHPRRPAPVPAAHGPPAGLRRLGRLRAELRRHRRRLGLRRGDVLPAERADRHPAAPGPRHDRRDRPGRQHPADRGGEREDRGLLRHVPRHRPDRHAGRDHPAGRTSAT